MTISLELSQRDGSNEVSQNTFIWRNMENNPLIIPLPLLIWSTGLWLSFDIVATTPFRVTLPNTDMSICCGAFGPQAFTCIIPLLEGWWFLFSHLSFSLSIHLLQRMEFHETYVSPLMQFCIWSFVTMSTVLHEPLPLDWYQIISNHLTEFYET